MQHTPLAVVLLNFATAVVTLAAAILKARLENRR